MRLGLLADVHANRHALDAAIAWAEGEGVDAWVCAGDLVGYGPDPDDCVARVAALDAAVVAGNHDLIVLGALSDERCIPLARASLAWTTRTISGATRERLAALPARATAPGGVLVAHGSLDDPQRYVRTAEEAAGELALAARLDEAVGIVVLGHTHVPLVAGARSGDVTGPGEGVLRLPAGERWVINPGSVGQSRERRPLARAAVLDLGERTVKLGRLPYDAVGCRAALRAAGLPPASCHLPPRPLRALAGRLLRPAGLRR